jgi:catechol 2,3-dioxygenase-like lactoylglutathione lyase family enzyme
LRALLAVALLAAGSAPAAAETPPANVVNIDRELKFYTEGLGMKLATTLSLGGTRREYILSFGSTPAPPNLLLMHDTSPDAPKKIDHGNAFSRLVLRVSNLEALAARLTALGYEHGEIRDAAQGYRIMMLADPEGYRLELVQSRQ